jgi:hypothetical protein
MRLALALIAAAVLMLPAAADARRIDRCELPDSATVEAVGGRLVVWSSQRRDRYDELVGKLVACRRTTGSSVRVEDTREDFDSHQAVRRVVVAGRYVAFYGDGHDHYGTRFRRVVVFDAFRRRETTREPVAFDPPFGDTILADVPALVLARSGAVAYVVQRESNRDYDGRPVERLAVRATDAVGRRLLDKGEGIDPASLRLEGTTLHWTNAREPRSAPLR